MAEVRVRRATEADVRAVATVHVASWREGYAHVFPRDRLAALSLDEREMLARNVLARPERGTLLVAEVDGAVVGFASAGAAFDPGIEAGEVYAIYVAPEHWGHGVGRALMERALQLLAERGFEQAVLWVLDDNPRARRFYEAGGWRLDGARRKGEHLGVHTEELRYRIDVRG
jgi:GNAT superfamily N-acetyltransferase